MEHFETYHFDLVRWENLHIIIFRKYNNCYAKKEIYFFLWTVADKVVRFVDDRMF